MADPTCPPFPALAGATLNAAKPDTTQDVEVLSLCDVDAAGVSTPFTRRISFNTSTGAVASTVDLTPAGTPYTPTGTVGACATPSKDSELSILCDTLAGNDKQFLRRITYSDGVPQAAVDTELDGVTPYTVVGTPAECGAGAAGAAITTAVLCDVQTSGSAIQFVRNFIFDKGVLVSTVNTTLSGTAYTPVGTVAECEPTAVCLPSAAVPVASAITGGDIIKPLVSQVATITGNPDYDGLIDDGGTFTQDPGSNAAPFPITEPLTGGSLTAPNTLLGAAHLTAPVTDAVGSGWLELNPATSGQRGAVIFTDPFDTASASFTAEFDWAMDQAGPSGPGDGMAVFFTDGTAPAPTALGGPFGAFGIVPMAGVAGLANHVFSVILSQWKDHSCDPALAGAQATCSTGPELVIRGPGNAQTTTAAANAANAYSVVTRTPLPNFSTNTRLNPAKIRVTAVTEDGKTLLSVQTITVAGTDWTNVIDRFDITSAVPIPASLRIGFVGTSGGTLNARNSLRGLTITEAAKEEWRSFRLVPADPIPTCATGLAVVGTVGVNITDDTQMTRGGNGDPEYFLYLVDEVKNGGTVLQKKRVNSAPALIGTTKTMTVASTIQLADLPNIRLYVGGKNIDAAGKYGAIFQDMKFTLTATGCPPTPVRTTPISAPCPIPVTIVSGGSGGGSGGTSVFSSAPMISTTVVCAVTATGLTPAVRHERVEAGATDSTITFFSSDGTIISPTSWSVGACGDSGTLYGPPVVACGADAKPYLVRSKFVLTNGISAETVEFSADGGITFTATAPVGALPLTAGACPEVAEFESVTTSEVCADGAPALRRETIKSDGTVSVTFLGATGAVVIPTAWTAGACPPAPVHDYEYDGITYACIAGVSYAVRNRYDGLLPVSTEWSSDGGETWSNAAPAGGPGTVGLCEPAPIPQVSIVETIVCADGAPALRRTTLTDGVVSSTEFVGATGAVITPTVWTAGACPVVDLEAASVAVSLVCAAGVELLRKEVIDTAGVSTVTFIGSDGVAVVAPATYTQGACKPAVEIDPPAVTTTLVCADGAPAIRREAINQAGVSTVTFIGATGVAVTPTVWTAGACAAPAEIDPPGITTTVVCADGAPAIRRESVDQAGVATVTFLGADGLAITPVAWAAGPCPATVSVSIDTEIIGPSLVCASGVQYFVRSIVKYDSAGVVTSSVTEYSTDGAAWTATAPAGPIVAGTCVQAVIAEHDITESLWCVDGQAYVRRNTYTESTGASVVRWYSPAGSIVILTAAEIAAATPGACLAATAAPAVFTSHVDTLGASNTTTITSPSKLVSWVVRHRSGVVTVTVNGVAIVLDTGETLGAEVDNGSGGLNDVVVVTTDAAGSARLVWVEQV